MPIAPFPIDDSGFHKKLIEDVKSTFDSLIADLKPGREDWWWWCDALFMAPPVLARLAAATGDECYLEFLNTMFWDTYDFLKGNCNGFSRLARRRTK